VGRSAKIVVETIPPRTWAVLRAGSAALLLLALAAALKRRLLLPTRDLARLAALSVFGVVINQVCFVEGLHRTTPTHSAIINTTIPIGALLFALLLGRESLDAAKALSVAVSFAGVMLVVYPQSSGFASVSLAGDLLTLVNAASYALLLVLSRRVLTRSDPLAATAVLMGLGFLGILAIGLPGLAALIVVFATVLTYFLNFWALARVESSLVALFTCVQPLIATALSLAVLGERPEPHVLAGGALVFAGVYLGLRRRAPTPLPGESREG
jgi:drug/metabolite transporter (DMT)-like permease